MGTILGRDEEETTPVNPDLVKYRNEQAKLMMNQEFDINDLPSTTERPLSPNLSIIAGTLLPNKNIWLTN